MRAWKLWLTVGGAVLALLLLMRPALAAPNGQGGTTMLSGTFSGGTEVPGPGDTDGAGTAMVTIDTTKNEACYDLTVTNITLPAAASHIHKAAAGASGPVVIPFDPAPGADGKAAACVSGDAAVLADIVANPANYYVNVHTSDFPQGAVRAQLAAQGGTAAPAQLPTTGGENDAALALAIAALVLLAGGALFARRAR
jgi:LPXTG-motif cell wall-anchored protein